MMLRYAVPCTVSALAFGLAGCPTSPAPDDPDGADGAAQVDGGDVVEADTGEPSDTSDTSDTGGMSDTEDAGDTTDGGGPSVPPTEFYYFTTGGGIADSDNYEMRLNFGAPSPRGTASGSDRQIRLAPVSP